MARCQLPSGHEKAKTVFFKFQVKKLPFSPLVLMRITLAVSKIKLAYSKAKGLLQRFFFVTLSDLPAGQN
jgi:hypothetical protein